MQGKSKPPKPIGTRISSPDLDLIGVCAFQIGLPMRTRRPSHANQCCPRSHSLAIHQSNWKIEIALSSPPEPPPPRLANRQSSHPLYDGFPFMIRPLTTDKPWQRYRLTRHSSQGKDPLLVMQPLWWMPARFGETPFGARGHAPLSRRLHTSGGAQ